MNAIEQNDSGGARSAAPLENPSPPDIVETEAARWQQQCDGALPGQLLTETQLRRELSHQAELGHAIEGDIEAGAIGWFASAIGHRFTYTRLTAAQVADWIAKWGRGW
jgi:hypothetical protein